MSFLDFTQQTSRVDVIGIWDKNFNQFVPFSRPMKCSVTEPSKNMEHPLETGSVVTDHRVILPVEAELSLIMNAAYYQDQYAQIKAAYLTGELFYLHTRVGVFANMMITDIPHDETPEMFDTITMALKLRKVQFATAQFLPLPARKVSDKTSQSTKQRGQTNGKEPNTEQAGKVEKSAAASAWDSVWPAS